MSRDSLKNKVSSSESYPVCLKLTGKRCVVIGGGKVAARKVGALLLSRALVWVISPTLTAPLKELLKKKRIKHLKRSYRRGDLNKAFLVLLATDNREINAKVFAEAKTKNLLISVADSPGESNFMLPAVLRQGDLTIAVSTNGLSPALAGEIKKELRNYYGREYKEFLKIMAKFRPKILKEVKDPRKRKKILQALAKQFISHRKSQETQALLKDIKR